MRTQRNAVEQVHQQADDCSHSPAVKALMSQDAARQVPDLLVAPGQQIGAVIIAGPRGCSSTARAALSPERSYRELI